ncbi:MAG: lecithin retinol acyltransferase family protein [Neptuniibacter sp.]
MSPDIDLKNSPYCEVPQLGDHIYCHRTGFTHHGIYIGNLEVIHYSGLHQGLRRGPITKTSLSEFLSGSELFIRKYSKSKLDPEEIKRRALSRIGENLYHPIFNNCEHFSEWCVNGKHKSRQADFYSAVGAGIPGFFVSKIGQKIAIALSRFINKRKK